MSKKLKLTRRTYDEEMAFVERINNYSWRIKKGFVPNMQVEGIFFANDLIQKLSQREMQQYCDAEEIGKFLPGLIQIGNVAALPGIVKASFGMPDLHSGYGFAIGNMAAFDVDDPNSIVCPGGIGYDINCGVRLIRTNLFEKDLREVQDELTNLLYENIPVGNDNNGIIRLTADNLKRVLTEGQDWCLSEGMAWEEDVLRCEEKGRLREAVPDYIDKQTLKRGNRIGSLGGGNHYAEVQIVEEIYDEVAAKAMGIKSVGQVCIMVHCGSRGLGYGVCSDAIKIMKQSKPDITLNNLELICDRIKSENGKKYLGSMFAAGNFAFANRSVLTWTIRKVFSSLFKKTAKELDMHLIYDVSHNIAKFEEHLVDGKPQNLLVHRKGCTRAFGPNHPHIPEEYKSIGQPVLIGGSMGSCSFVLTGTEHGMQTCFGSTCHGAGRSMSRTESLRSLEADKVLESLKTKGISIRVAKEKSIMEEAPESYKDVCQVIETCELAGISKKAFKLKPVCVIKG